MSQTVIRVEGLGKRYRIGEGARHTGLRHLIGDALRAPVRLLTGSKDDSKNGSVHGSNDGPNAGPNRRGSPFIWALKDVSFEICQGEVVGLIGRNGAGKSTLLKILARITRPTEGYAEIRGRVGSLLEVGTGFHGELSGRENVYMSGAILGMRKAEIDRKFDEIVAFSEVERFLDTPLKHYSSGMQMRLAFAVAAHLEPEILLVDEVLAVGDAEFQKKCLGKMGDISKQGRTIIFVSHNVNAVSSLCRSAMLLGGGRIVEYADDVQKVLRHYLSPAISAHTVTLSHHPNRTSSSAGIFEEIAIEDQCGGPSQCVLPGANVVIRLRVRPAGKIRNPRVSIGVTSYRGERIFAIGTHIGGTVIPSVEGPSTIRVQFTAPPLVPGEYSLDIGFYDGTGIPLDTIYGAAALTVLKDEYLSMVAEHGPYTGQIMVRSDWTCAPNPDANSSELISTVSCDANPSEPRNNS
jgi:lipopolysaccharide transport system ATP-binding protein